MSLTKATNRMITGSVQNILDFIPEIEHDGIKAGTSSYDCTSAINLALGQMAADTIKSQVLFFPQGTYTVTSTISMPFAASFGNKAVFMVGEECGTNTWSRSRIQGNVNGPVIEVVGNYIGPTDDDYDPHIGHGVRNLTIVNTSSDTTTSIALRFNFGHSSVCENVSLGASAIGLEIGPFSTNIFFRHVRIQGPEIGVSSVKSWACAFYDLQIYFCKAAIKTSGDYISFTNPTLENNDVVFSCGGSTVVVTKPHVESFEVYFTNDGDPVAAVDDSFASAGYGSGGDYRTSFLQSGGYMVGWKGNTPAFVIRPVAVGRHAIVEIAGIFVAATIADGALKFCSAFNDLSTLSTNGTFSIVNTQSLKKFALPNTSAGDRQELFHNVTIEEEGTGSRTNLFTSKMKVGQLKTKTYLEQGSASRTINAGSYASWTRTVTGARPGDFVLYSHNGGIPAGVIVSASVTANDTVTINAYNDTASNVALANFSEYVMTIPHQQMA